MSKDVHNEDTFKLVRFVMYYCAVSSLFSVLFCHCCHLILVLKCQLVDHIVQIDGNVELAIKRLLKEQDTYLFKQRTEKLILQYDCFSVIVWTICKTSMSCSVTSCTLEMQWITLSYVYFFFYCFWLHCLLFFLPSPSLPLTSPI